MFVIAVKLSERMVYTLMAQSWPLHQTVEDEDGQLEEHEKVTHGQVGDEDVGRSAQVPRTARI